MAERAFAKNGYHGASIVEITRNAGVAFGAFFDWIGDRPGILRLLREAEFVDPTLLSELYTASAVEYRSRIEGAIRRGYIVPTDPEVLAWCIMGMTEFAVLRWLVWPGEKRMERERFDAFIEVFIRTFGVESAPA